MLRSVALAAALLLLQPFAARAQPAVPPPQTGDRHEIRIESRMSSTSSDGGSASSQSRSMLVERVVAVRDGGVELEYDLPPDATAEERAADWHFPVRVLKPPEGPLQLLNGPELEARVDRWLRGAGLPREACGRWYFTWDAFQIDCDPQSVIASLAHVDLRADALRDGAPWQDDIGLAPSVLRSESTPSGGARSVARIEVDAEAYRREEARMNAVLDEILGDRPDRRGFARQRAAERVTGTVTVTFEADAQGTLRRTRAIELDILRRDGARVSETRTERVERRRAPPR